MSLAFYLTIGFALALVVPTVAAIALLTFVTRKSVLTLEATTARLDSAISSLSAKISSLEQSKSPAALKAALDDLAAALDAHSAQTRKQFGKVWGTIGAGRPANGHDADVDDDLAALIALQTAPAPGPQPQ